MNILKRYLLEWNFSPMDSDDKEEKVVPLKKQSSSKKRKTSLSRSQTGRDLAAHLDATPSGIGYRSNRKKANVIRGQADQQHKYADSLLPKIYAKRAGIAAAGVAGLGAAGYGAKRLYNRYKKRHSFVGRMKSRIRKFIK